MNEGIEASAKFLLGVEVGSGADSFNLSPARA